jgi:hypothetical protein
MVAGSWDGRVGSSVDKGHRSPLQSIPINEEKKQQTTRTRYPRVGRPVGADFLEHGLIERERTECRSRQVSLSESEVRRSASGFPSPPLDRGSSAQVDPPASSRYGRTLRKPTPPAAKTQGPKSLALTFQRLRSKERVFGPGPKFPHFEFPHSGRDSFPSGVIGQRRRASTVASEDRRHFGGPASVLVAPPSCRPHSRQVVSPSSALRPQPRQYWSVSAWMPACVRRT